MIWICPSLIDMHREFAEVRPYSLDLSYMVLPYGCPLAYRAEHRRVAPPSHTSNSTLQCGSPGPPDGLKSNKVYDTAVTRYSDRHFSNLNLLQCTVSTITTRSHCSPSGGPVWSVSYIVMAVWTFGTPPKLPNFFGQNRIFAESRRSIFGEKRNLSKQFKLLYSALKPKPNFGRSLVYVLAHCPMSPNEPKQSCKLQKWLWILSLVLTKSFLCHRLEFLLQVSFIPCNVLPAWSLALCLSISVTSQSSVKMAKLISHPSNAV